MSVSRLACFGLLFQWATQTCLAATVEQLGTAPLYSSVDKDGVILFTNIPSVGEGMRPNVELSARQGTARARPMSADGPENRAMIHTAEVQTPSQKRGEPQADSGTEEHPAEEIAPARRDGGPPPDDH